MNGKALQRIHLEQGRVAVPIVAVLMAVLACSPGPSTPTPPFEVQVGTMMASTVSPSIGSTATAPGEDEGECSHDYFPTDEGSSWVYESRSDGGGAQTRTTTIASEGEDGFSVEIALSSGATFLIEWSCNNGDLTQLTPTATLSFSGSSADVTTINHSGVTLPADLDAEPSWRESGEWSVTNEGQTMTGSYTSDNAAVGTEVVTVPFGTFEAMRIDSTGEGTFNGEPTPTCQVSQWWTKDVGLVKQETTCPVGSQEMTEVVELADFTSPN